MIPKSSRGMPPQAKPGKQAQAHSNQRAVRKINEPGGDHVLVFEHGCWVFGSSQARFSRICGLMLKCGFRPKELAEKLRISYRTFYRVVVRCLGVTPGDWLRDARSAHARKLLSAGLPAKQVAHDLGFRHQSDFATDFRRRHGMPPGEYLKMMSRIADDIRGRIG
jgi:AraC-like DNA-binding protein